MAASKAVRLAEAEPLDIETMASDGYGTGKSEKASGSSAGYGDSGSLERATSHQSSDGYGEVKLVYKCDARSNGSTRVNEVARRRSTALAAAAE